MITSLFDLLRDTLPIHAVFSEAQVKSGWVSPVPADQVRRLMACQAPNEAAHVEHRPVPRVPPASWFQTLQGTYALRDEVLAARLWSWKKTGPNTIADVCCRARESGYKLHRVLQKITFGLDGAPRIKVKTAQGQDLFLPLDAKFMVGQFVVHGGAVLAGLHNLWPLEALHDSGIVMAFVYELPIDGAGKITGVAPFRPSGAGKWKPVREDERRLLSQLAPRSIADKDAWLEVMTGPCMHAERNPYMPAAKVHQNVTVKVGLHRIVVALSLATFRERADFEPGGLVGMAKIFPHIMVCSSVKLSEMHATVRIDRTPDTQPIEGDGTPKTKGPCCGAYDQVGAMLVSDANETGSLAQKPFWGGTFAYVQEDADKHHAGRRLKVVDRSKGKRTYPGGKRFAVTRAIDNLTHPLKEGFVPSLFGFGAIPIHGVEKVAGQGEFDNLHLAPALKLDLAMARHEMAPTRFAPRRHVDYPNVPAETHTDRVWMAPFCAHDCFHTHWRWGQHESAQWTKGWSATGPYQVSGAPMVPLHQSVELELHSASSFSYHAHSRYGTGHVTGRWDIVNHHGSAYAQSIANWLQLQGSHLNVWLENSVYTFLDSKGRRLEISKHAPLMYWLFRYQVGVKDGRISVSPRIQFSRAELDGARKA